MAHSPIVGNERESKKFGYDVRSLDSREERERASKYGADSGDRTRDINVGDVVLCH
jgi:hypothetical protein